MPILEYIWLDKESNFRSKVKVINELGFYIESITDIPKWNYDGSSTDDMRKTSNLRSFLLASCFGGLCVVDLELKKVVVRMWTAKEKFGGCKISNAAVAKRHGMVILTGNCGISMIPLRNKMKVTSEDEVYSEL